MVNPEFDWRAACIDAERRYTEMQRDRDRWMFLVEDIAKAVLIKGKHPRHHDSTLNRHRTEWPYLWERIDAAIKESHGDR